MSRLTGAGTEASGHSTLKDSTMATREYSSVAEMLDSTLEDTGIADEVKKAIQQRNITQQLKRMRIRAGLSQMDMAEKLECNQSRVSKLENADDASLRLGELAAYTQALGWTVKIEFQPGEQTIMDRVKHHVLATHKYLDELATLALKDEEIANGVAKSFAEVLFDQLRLLQLAVSKMPHNPKTRKPYLELQMDMTEIPGNSPAGDDADSRSEIHNVSDENCCLT